MFLAAHISPAQRCTNPPVKGVMETSVAQLTVGTLRVITGHIIAVIVLLSLSVE